MCNLQVPCSFKAISIASEVCKNVFKHFLFNTSCNSWSKKLIIFCCYKSLRCGVVKAKMVGGFTCFHMFSIILFSVLWHSPRRELSNYNSYLSNQIFMKDLQRPWVSMCLLLEFVVSNYYCLHLSGWEFWHCRPVLK